MDRRLCAVHTPLPVCSYLFPSLFSNKSSTAQYSEYSMPMLSREFISQKIVGVALVQLAEIGGKAGASPPLLSCTHFVNTNIFVGAKIDSVYMDRLKGQRSTCRGEGFRKVKAQEVAPTREAPCHLSGEFYYLGFPLTLLIHWLGKI